MTNSIKEYWYLVEFLTGNERAAVDRVIKLMQFTVEHYHRMLVLTAGVVAFVPPLLNQSSLPINQWFVRRGVMSFFVTIALGVLTLAFSRTLLVALLRNTLEDSDRLGARVGYAIRESEPGRVDDAVRQAFEDHAVTEVIPRERFFWWGLAFVLLWDVAVHACFVYGAWCLFRAAYF